MIYPPTYLARSLGNNHDQGKIISMSSFDGRAVMCRLTIQHETSE